MVPVVTGHVDWTALGQLTDAFAGADRRPLTPAGGGAGRRLARALLGLAIDALSGPGGLAAALRANLAGTELSLATPLTSVSLPLDVGATGEAIPASCAARSPCGIRAVASPVAASPPACATCTIWCPGRRAASPRCTTWYRCAGSIT